jgi:hypothetical protein
MLPSTVGRVPLNTASDVNQQIRDETRRNVEHLAGGSDRAIEQRLHQLDDEWDIERTLEANAATVALAGVALGTFVDRRLFVLPAIVGGFLLQHALQGWCPPVPIFRRLGFRTQAEIARERYALKALRGDFRESPAGRGGADQALRAVSR